MFDIGMQELIVIFIVALLVFGPKRLPELGRTIGKGMVELKKALHGVKEQVNAEINEIEKPVESIVDKAEKIIKEGEAGLQETPEQKNDNRGEVNGR